MASEQSAPLMGIDFKERDEIAEANGISPRYLYQCVSGRREMDPKDAVALERSCGGRLRRWNLRTKTWHLIWPELIGAEGAPAVPAPQSTVAQPADLSLSP